ncbi:MAG: CPBP family intramembrane glutamic endopeptidase [Pirellulaceae bacterium]
MVPRRALVGALAFTMVVPTVITWLYFLALNDRPSSYQQVAYVAGKLVQFGFPIAWVLWVERERPRWSRKVSKRGLALGFLFGGAVASAMFGLYFGYLRPSGFFDEPAMAVRRRIASIGLTSVWTYRLVAVFYALGHSFLEEYYWRWFVFRRWQQLVPLTGAVIASSLGFMAHHVLVLAQYFGWSSPTTWLFAGAVAVGGACWAWLYHVTQSLWVPWIGHCLIDAAIFVIGYDLARELIRA